MAVLARRRPHPNGQLAVHSARHDRLLADINSGIGLRVHRTCERRHVGVQLLPGVAGVIRRPQPRRRKHGARRTTDRYRPLLRGQLALSAQAQPGRGPDGYAVQRGRLAPTSAPPPGPVNEADSCCHSVPSLELHRTGCSTEPLPVVPP